MTLKGTPNEINLTIVTRTCQYIRKSLLYRKVLSDKLKSFKVPRQTVFASRVEKESDREFSNECPGDVRYTKRRAQFEFQLDTKIFIFHLDFPFLSLFFINIIISSSKSCLDKFSRTSSRSRCVIILLYHVQRASFREWNVCVCVCGFWL